MVLTAIDDDLARGTRRRSSRHRALRRRVRPEVRNFYADLVRRYGFEAEVDAIQGAALEGRMGDATAAVTDAMVDTLALARVGRSCS
jgi:hypothetical protein